MSVIVSDMPSKKYIDLLRTETSEMSEEMNELLDAIIIYVDEIEQNHENVAKNYEKKLNRYLNIIKKKFPEELELILPYECKELITKLKEGSKSRYSYILHYKGKIQLDSIELFYCKGTKAAKEIVHGYDTARDETIVYVDYNPAKQCTGCSTFMINDITPYGAAPKRGEKNGCIAYVKTLEAIEKSSM